MASTETRPATAGITSSWRSLGRMGAYQVPIVLGSILAVFGSVVAYVAAVARRAELVAPSTSGIFLTFLGALGLVGYFVTRDNVKNGCIVAAVAGVGLLLLGGRSASSRGSSSSSARSGAWHGPCNPASGHSPFFCGTPAMRSLISWTRP